MLSAHLGAAGTITDVFIATDRETGRSRGFAFVTFSSEAEATRCIESFENAELDGRRLTINEARDRPPRRNDGGGGYGPSPFEMPSFGDGDAGGGGKRKPFKAKGSRRGLRARKRSL